MLGASAPPHARLGRIGDPRPRCLQTSRSKPPAAPPATPILTRHSAADSVSQAGGDEGGHAVSLAPIPVLPVGPGGPTAQRPHRRRRAGVGHRAAEGVNLTRAGSCLARLLPITASFLPKRPTVINNMSQQLPVSLAQGLSVSGSERRLLGTCLGRPGSCGLSGAEAGAQGRQRD